MPGSSPLNAGSPDARPPARHTPEPSQAVMLQDWHQLPPSERWRVAVLCVVFLLAFWLVVMYAGFAPRG